MHHSLKRRSLAWFALLALLVIIFSYLLSIAIAIACAVLPVVLILNGFGGLGAVALLVLGPIMSITILWSLVPRRDRLEPNGIRIELNAHPKLRALIEDIAGRLDEQLPRFLYLVPDPNAFVAERNGILGFGGERIMGFGLPILATLTVSEFRAVLAHEFAHYYSGDTRLGPRIYATRSAMARTLKNLASDSAVLGFLRRFAPAALLYVVVVGGMVAYWKLFLRVTQLVSRKQEHRSDELACHIAGPHAMAEGLKRARIAGFLVHSFWSSVMSPLLAAGFRSPVGEGFQRSYAAPAMGAAVSNFLEKVIENEKTSAYDTHPPLKARLEHIAKMSVQGEFSEDSSSALGLLEHIDQLEMQLLEALLPEKRGSLEPVSWESGRGNSLDSTLAKIC